VFGDFLGAARRQVAPAAGFREAVWAGGHVAEVRHSLLRVVIVMGRYVQDTRVAPAPDPSPETPAPTGWDRAGTEACQALIHAAAALHGDAAGRRQPGVRAGSELVRRLDAAAVSLTYGRDLLQTHLARDPQSGRQFRSEWGSILTSPPVSWALLAEMGVLAHQLASLGEGLERSPRARGSPEARRSLNAACHWLQNMHASIRIAQRHQPVSAADRELLHAIRVNARPARRLPDGSESVSALCTGVIEAAERVRHAAWRSELEPAWSPRVTVNSLRQVAAASTITSHHCEIVLRSLADGLEDADDGLRGGLIQAAEAAGQARTRWLAVAHSLDQVTTDTQKHLSQGAVGANDLALWTGRLAYADPSWTVARRAIRPSQNLVQQPEGLEWARHAVHQALESIARLARADGKQIRATANARRILVTSPPTSDAWEATLPFAPAPPERVDAILALYQYAATICGEATGRVRDASAIAQALKRPGLYSPDGPGCRHREPRTETGVAERPVAGPWGAGGAVEQTLYALGVTDARLLCWGAQIDRAGEQLIAEAKAAQGSPHGVGPVRSGKTREMGSTSSGARVRRSAERMIPVPDWECAAHLEALQAEP
jgi:hypothetical protein